MYKFNCQDQQILSKLLLLTIENTRLTNIIQSSAPSVHSDDHYVLNRIGQIQKQMGNQLKFKDQKIQELNSYVVQLHQMNEDLSNKLDNLQVNYKNLELTSNSYIDTCIQSRDQTFSQTIQQHQYHIKVLEKEKDDTIHQLQRLKNGVLKQYEADIQVLKRQNRSLITSLNNYRAEQLNSQSDRAKFEEKNKQCINKLNEISLEKLFLEKEIQKKTAQIETLRQSSAKQIQAQNKQIQRIGKLAEDNEKQSRAKIQSMVIELQKSKEILESFQKQKLSITRQKDEQIHKLNEKIKVIQCQSLKLKEEQRKSKEELQKVYRKLRDYDRQYDLYVKKMENTYLQIGRLKQENSQSACDYQNKSKQLKQYYDQSVQQIYTHCANLQLQNKALKSSREQLEHFYKQKQEQNEMKYLSNFTSLQKELDQLKKQNNQYKRKVEQLDKDKNNAVEQWKDIVQEMGKQKNIIHSFEQEIQSYRNSIKNDIINKQRDRMETNISTKTEVEQKNQRDETYSLSFDRTQEETNLRIEQTMRQKKSQNSFNYKSIQLTGPKSQIERDKIMKSAYPYREKREQIMPVRNENLFYSYGQSTKIFRANLIPDTHRSTSLGQKTREEINKKYEYLKKGQNQKEEKKQFNSHYSQSYQKTSSRRIPTESYESFSTNSNDKLEQKYGQGKMKRSNSAKYMKYDLKQSQIQQHLSFEIGNNFQFKSQTQKFQQQNRNYSQRLKTEEQLKSAPDKTFLIEKINKISSWRDSSQSNRFLKGTSFTKKPMMQMISRGKEDIRAEKENLNEIISRKCRQIIQK